jgi:hypothetical protein
MERKILSKEDIDMLTKMLDALKDNTPKESLSYNLLDGILEFLTKPTETEAEAEEEEAAETEIRKKWGWSPERRAKQLKNLAKKKAKAKAKWSWSPARKEKQRLSMKKAWAKRKAETQPTFDISKAFK